MTDNALQQASALVRETFELGKPDTLGPGSEQELLALLADRIAEMLEQRPEYLMSLLYRLDVLEKKIVPVMRPDAPEPANWGLARLVLERQKERAETKRTVKPEPLEGLEDWKW